jgi:type II secretory pathway pseudopilin PulG
VADRGGVLPSSCRRSARREGDRPPPSRASIRPQAGFTFVEATIVVAILTTMMTAFGQVFTRSQGVADGSLATLRAHEEHTKNLRAIADLLRGAAWDTLTGFALDGTASAPTFCRLLGSDVKGRLIDLPETLSHRTTSQPVDGVDAPGEVVLSRGGVPTAVIAPRVPVGGFRVLLSGNTLEVTLTTYYSTSSRRVAMVTGAVSVSLRN